VAAKVAKTWGGRYEEEVSRRVEKWTDGGGCGVLVLSFHWPLRFEGVG